MKIAVAGTGCYEVISNTDEFKQISDVILANRVEKALADIRGKLKKEYSGGRRHKALSSYAGGK